ncbi:hypothetical protein LguiA_025075 [Lonicera macranthoides]
MNSSICRPTFLQTPLKLNSSFLLSSHSLLSKRLPYARTSRVYLTTTRAQLSTNKETVLKDFHERRALKIISGLQNLDRDNVASVVTAADKGGATHVDIACDPDLVKLATSLTTLPICVSSVDPSAFAAAVEAGALMVEIGNYDSFYEMGIVFTSEQILSLTKETKRILPLVALSVTVPHTLSLPDQVKLAEELEQEGVDASPTLAAAYSISRAVKIPVMCSSGLSAVTAPMAITAGAAGVGVGSAINKLNNVVAMIAEVRSIADSLQVSSDIKNETEKKHLRL